jgi:hypothetical protein
MTETIPSIIWDCVEGRQDTDALCISTTGDEAGYPIFVFRDGGFFPVMKDGDPVCVMMPGRYTVIPVRVG